MEMTLKRKRNSVKQVKEDDDCACYVRIVHGGFVGNMYNLNIRLMICLLLV